MNYIPCVIRESSEGLARLPIPDILLQSRKVYLIGEVNQTSASAIIMQLDYLHDDNPEKEITLYIDSPGGEVRSGLAIYDTMKRISCPVHTVCVGTAASMAALLFAAGDVREMLPHGDVMIHDPLCQNMSGSAMTIRDATDRLMDLRKELATILAEATGHSLQEIYQKTSKDTHFTAEEAVKFGLADRIIAGARKGDAT